MSDLWTSLLFGFAGLVIGFMGGQAIAWRRRGSLIVPTYHPVGRRSNLVVGLLIVVLAFGTLAQGVYNEQRQSRCNDEFRRVIAERGELTQRQTAANLALQRDLSLIDEVYLPEALADETQRVRYIESQDKARGKYIAELETLDEQRRSNPYPSPVC